MKRLGREKDIHSESGLFKPKLWSRQIFKKGMAYFLCFVLLVGNMQGISCAEGNLEETAERIESEEPQSVSHDSENEHASSEEGISSGNEEEAGNQAENGENIAEDRPEEIGAEDGSEENSEAGESGLSEEEVQKKKYRRKRRNIWTPLLLACKQIMIL